MNPLVLSSAQKQAIRQSSPQAACHLLCDITDDPFYFGNADEITGWIRNVLCIETFFGAMCDGGIVTWFDWGHGLLAHLAPNALHAVGLKEFASCAERALAIHSAPPYPATIEGWREEIERIRNVQMNDDFDSAIYAPIEDDFFSLYHSDPGHYRTKLHEYVLAHLDD